MTRYFALVWDARSQEQCVVAELLTQRITSRAETWEKVLDARGLRVLFAPSPLGRRGASILPNKRGAILGNVFRRSSSPEDMSPPASFSEIESDQIVRSQGRELIDAYWGSYVAFLYNGSSGARMILRSPMSAPPCLNVEFRGVDVFFSRLEDWTRLRVARLTVNWDYVIAFSVFGRQWCAESAFNELTEIHGSECIEIGERRSTSVLWNPRAIATSDAIDDMAMATTLLGQTTRSCVQTLASIHKSIIHRLSGGLDSSIVAACLANGPATTDILCEHLFSDDPSEDERRYARMVAAHVGFNMVEVAGRTDLDFETMPRLTSSIIPCAGYAYLDVTRPEVELAGSRAASAIFTGDFGDLLFHYAPALPAIAEYMTRRGIDRGLLNVLLDVCTIERVSIWNVLRRHLRDSGKPIRFLWSPYKLLTKHVDSKGLTSDALDWFGRNVDRFVHPWLQDVTGVPLGKLWQIWQLPNDSHWHNPASTAADPVIAKPLGGEPLVELCLRIPTDLSVRNGWDRAVARHAFAHALPSEIILRTSKGCPEERIRNLVTRNARFIRDMLLDGKLVQEKILSRSRLEEAMPGAVTATQSIGSDLLDQLGTEVWVRRWTEESAVVELSDDGAASYAVAHA